MFTSTPGQHAASTLRSVHRFDPIPGYVNIILNESHLVLQNVHANTTLQVTNDGLDESAVSTLDFQTGHGYGHGYGAVGPSFLKVFRAHVTI